VADFTNSRCERTVDNSYSATSHQNSKHMGYSCSEREWQMPTGLIFNTDWSKASITVQLYYKGCTFTTMGMVYSGQCYDDDSGAWLYTWRCDEITTSYSCPSGGTLSGTTCTKIDTEYLNFSDI
jgi:hypothetical protein